ncbi:MAG: DNA-binding response regulator [Candidatus Lloydbacteria bacterium RIFOXYC12_FULL_46_25]|uniref:DNA-binding response regulator n=1 Tax=Candidatus Lloydbacteria bacterium RIFOXYC12_FULL_46_25 TaxID=1798670 RepID=A0A1G2DRJ3_9BACT|nr:MAG: DNA-binding response regulator [Candidatus Lloydbacteria bacterium RIFOXYC12_FULL_46_25]
MKILIVDDEEKLADALARGLTLKGYTTDVLYDGKSALTRISLHSKDYDLVILDLMLPFVSGTEICKTVRELGVTVPILILTAQSDVENKVDLLLSGADDYMVKPFSFDELAARVHVILRRPQETVQQKVAVGGIALNATLRTATKDGVSLMLTLKEFALLEYLMRHPNEVVNREELLSHLWDFNYDSFSNVVDVHVKNLRKKLDEGSGPSILETVRGIGYRLRI